MISVDLYFMFVILFTVAVFIIVLRSFLRHIEKEEATERQSTSNQKITQKHNPV